MIRLTEKHIVARLLGVLLVAIPGSRIAVGVKTVQGEIGPGSVYGLFVPEGWNSGLALYAHGYVDASTPIGLPAAAQIDPLRDAMLDMGYAVAYPTTLKTDGPSKTASAGPGSCREFSLPRSGHRTGPA